MLSLIDKMAEAIIEKGRKSSSGHVLILDALSIKQIIEQVIHNEAELLKANHVKSGIKY